MTQLIPNYLALRMQQSPTECGKLLVLKTMTMDLFQLRAHEGQKIIGEILHTMIEHN